MKRLSIYFTRTRASVTVEDESSCERDTSAGNMPTTIANMRPDDRDLLVRFCVSVIECVNGDSSKLIAIAAAKDGANG